MVYHQADLDGIWYVILNAPEREGGGECAC